MQSSPPWYTKLVKRMLLASIVSVWISDELSCDSRSSLPNPSVFCTQLLPYGAFVAVALQYNSSNHMSVPFMILQLQSGGSLTKNFLTVTSETFQKTNGIGRPGCVSPASAVYLVRRQLGSTQDFEIARNALPDVSIAMNASRSISIDAYVIACQDERSSMILESDWVGGAVLSPVLDIRRELVLVSAFSYPHRHTPLLTVQMPRQSMLISFTIGFNFEAM